MKAIVRIEVPDYQIGQEVSIYFKDTMMIKGIVQEPKTDILDKISDEVCDIDDKIVLNPDSLFERKAYVRFNKVIDIIDKYKAESEDKG